MTSTANSPGRLGNQIFRNIITSEIARLNGLKVNEYGMYNQHVGLGIQLYTHGKNEYRSTIEITDDNCLDYLIHHKPARANINTNNHYFQTPEVTRYIYQCLTSEPQKNSIMNTNKYKERYNNNNDLFVHLRLGDAYYLHPNIEYYDEAISKCHDFTNGYISTEPHSYTHPLCQELIRKYKLKPLPTNLDEVNTIMFASTCKNIVLSNGSFSWTMGALGFYSKVIYPELIELWTGDIYVIPEWIEILRPNHRLHARFFDYSDSVGNIVVRKSKQGNNSVDNTVRPSSTKMKMKFH